MPVMSIATISNISSAVFKSFPDISSYNIIINNDSINNNNNNNHNNHNHGPTNTPTTSTTTTITATSTTIYYTIAAILSITLVIGVFFNGVAVYIFVKNKDLRTPTNSFVMTLCVCDLLMCLLGITIPAVKAWQRSPIHSHVLCAFDGFVVYFLGLSSMYILAAIAVDRYVVIVRPLTSLVVTQRMALLSIGVCFGLGLFWTTLPLLGWNGFVPEGIGVSCSISWRSLEAASTSYILTIFVFCMLLPLLVMGLCYLNIYWAIRRTARHSPWGPNSHIAQNNHRLERRMLRTIIFMLGAYLVSWTPYAVVSLTQTFSGQPVVDPLTETFPALIAKMSAIWDPIIYIATNLQFRQAFFKALPCRELCSCPGKAQSETSDSAQDESGPVLDEIRSGRTKKHLGGGGGGQSLELSQKTGHSQTQLPVELNGKCETVTLALLAEDGTVVCELAEKAVDMAPAPED